MLYCQQCGHDDTALGSAHSSASHVGSEVGELREVGTVVPQEQISFCGAIVAQALFIFLPNSTQAYRTEKGKLLYHREKLADWR